MARLGELVATVPTQIAIGASFVANRLSSSVVDPRRIAILNNLSRLAKDSGLDSPSRHGGSPFANHAGEALLHELSGILPQQTQDAATYAGFVLNFLSMIGYATSNRESFVKDVPILGPLRPVVEIISTLSLAMAPNVILAMYEQSRFLQTATHLGIAEAFMTFVPALFVLPALLKVPSMIEGAGWVAKKVVVEPIAGAVRGLANTQIRKNRQAELQARQREEGKIEQDVRLFPKVARILEKQRSQRQARMSNSLPEIEVPYARLGARVAECFSRANPIVPDPIYARLHKEVLSQPLISPHAKVSRILRHYPPKNK